MISGHALILIACLFLSTSTFLCAQQFYGSNSNLSTSWINQPSMLVNDSGIASHTFSPIMMRINGTSAFYCGFYCVPDVNTPDGPDAKDCLFCNNQRRRDCIFGVFIAINRNYSFFDYYIQFPRLVWSANSNHPVQVNATLQLSQDGELILRNSDGTPVWSSQTDEKSVAGMNLTENGNLVLFGQHNEIIWQSFDYPIDSLLPGQKLNLGQRLISSASASNWNWSEGLSYLVLDYAGLGAYISDPPQRYYFRSSADNSSYVEFTGGSLVFQNERSRRFQSGNKSSTAQFMTLGADGKLNVFQSDENGWTILYDLIGQDSRPCALPLVCGKYGVCSGAGQCGCPDATTDQGSFFKETNFRQPNLGCSLITPISCDLSQYHNILELTNTYYFSFTLDELDTTLDECKNLCLRNCSCKAAVFAKESNRVRSNVRCRLPNTSNGGRPSINGNSLSPNPSYWGIPLENGSCLLPNASYWDKSSDNGSCLLLYEVYSIANNENQLASQYNTTLYVKVQLPHLKAELPFVKASRVKVIILASAFSAILGAFSVIGSCLFLLRKRNKQQHSDIEDEFLDQVPGMPTRYTYEDLKATTEDFSKKLGEGGFGSVYEGTLSNGTKIAVKCLDGLAKLRDSFLVEVKAIGGIHHVNLVKLIGFCFDKSHSLLVYEYMVNKSLDGWIFNGNEEYRCLPWKVRRNIISDIAKGLAYLHEECSPKIIHLDIKPQNILLDESFNAKISDFGLSKLIEKDESRVITTMRGTPGYLAPEWLSSAITEKADVYSFGVVMLEIICGRKNLDWSRTEEDRHLLAVFKGKAEEGKLKELADERSQDMHENIEEVVGMMKIAAWCLQGDFTKRPSMSLVVKVLEGLVAAETNIEYDFSHPTLFTWTECSDPSEEAAYNDATRLLASALSGAR